jgi:hypothetical protein
MIYLTADYKKAVLRIKKPTVWVGCKKQQFTLLFERVRQTISSAFVCFF